MTPRKTCGEAKVAAMQTYNDGYSHPEKNKKLCYREEHSASVMLSRCRPTL